MISVAFSATFIQSFLRAQPAAREYRNAGYSHRKLLFPPYFTPKLNFPPFRGSSLLDFPPRPTPLFPPRPPRIPPRPLPGLWKGTLDSPIVPVEVGSLVSPSVAGESADDPTAAIRGIK